MLKITNGYEDRDATVTSRHITTGQDGEAVTVAPGESAEIELDGEYQVSVSTRGRNPGEEPIRNTPVARVVEGGTTEGAKSDAPTLNEASDDDVRTEIQTMVDEKANLTQSGKPELPVLNERLAAKGFGPVDSKRRDALMPAPAPAL